MRLLKEWVDTKYNVKNFLYENDYGLKVFHTLNTQTTETYISYILKAGAYFEKQLNVPNGTAHFLEHLLFKPNSKFKTIDEIDKFEFGNRERAKLFINGGTNFQNMYIYGSTHFTRELDLAKRLNNVVSYPIDIEKYIEEERKVILSEHSRGVKLEKNKYLQFTKFALSGKVHNSNFSVIGEDTKSIVSITKDDILKLYKALFIIPNMIVSVQSPQKLTKSMLDQFNQLSKILPENADIKPTIFHEKLKNEFNVGYFFNTESTGINITFFKLDDYLKRKKVDYKKKLLENLHNSLINYLAYNELREKKGLLYSLDSISLKSALWEYAYFGFDVTSPEEKLPQLLEELYTLYYFRTKKFLKTKPGQRWFENKISSYIFPSTISYDEAYAESKAASILDGREINESDKYKKEALKATIENLITFADTQNLFVDTTIWVDTHIEIEKVKKIIENSTIYKKNTKAL